MADITKARRIVNNIKEMIRSTSAGTSVDRSDLVALADGFIALDETIDAIKLADQARQMLRAVKNSHCGVVECPSWILERLANSVLGIKEEL